MLDRILLTIANMIAVLGGLVSFVILFFAFIGLLSGGDPLGDLALAATISIVTYCFAGTLHRIVASPEGPRA